MSQLKDSWIDQNMASVTLASCKGNTRNRSINREMI